MSAQVYMCYQTSTINNRNLDDNFKHDNPHLSSNVIHAGVPYIFRGNSAQEPTLQMQRDIRSLLSLPMEQRRNLASLNVQMGSDVMVAFAELFENELLPASKHLNQWAGEEKANLAGAGISLLWERKSQFQKLLSNYERALEDVRIGEKKKLPKLEMVKLENYARNLYEQLDTVFHQELTRLTQKVKSRRGTALTNVERGIHQAKSARTAAPIQISNSMELNRLRNLSTGLKYGGKLLIANDLYGRSKKVVKDYINGNDWERTALVQSSGFAAGYYAGDIAAATVTRAAITIGLSSTPIGWVIAICIGAAVTYYVATKADQRVRNAIASKYDKYR